MTPVLFLAALLSVADPQGDAIGQGNLTPPTAVMFRAPGIFDAQQITVPEAETFGFELTMGQLSNPWRLANGFSFPIIEVYLSTKSGGQNTLLPGSNMRLPEGQGWHYAFRLTGDQFDVYRATEQGMPVQVTDMIGAQLEVVNNTLHVRTNLPLPERYSIFGMVGSYDPFTETGWRVVTDTPNPWAFSSREPSVPVIDVIADSFSMQRAALARGVLPEIRSAVRQDAWLIVAAVGFAFMMVAAFGQLLLPKRPAKRSLAAANQAIKAPSQAVGNTPTKPQTPQTSKHTAHKVARAKPLTAKQAATGRRSRGKPSNNAARGLARQQTAASQAPNANQPVPLGDKLVLASDADTITQTPVTQTPVTQTPVTQTPVTQTPTAKVATDNVATDNVATDNVATDKVSANKIAANEIAASKSSANETATSQAPTAQPTTTKTLRPPPDNALRPRSAPSTSAARATAATLETSPAVASDAPDPVIEAFPELVTEAMLDATTAEKISEVETVDMKSVNIESADSESVNIESADLESVDSESVDSESVDIESAPIRPAHAVTALSPEQDVFSEETPQTPSPSAFARATTQDATEQTPVESSVTPSESQKQSQEKLQEHKALSKKRRAATSPRASTQPLGKGSTPQNAAKTDLPDSSASDADTLDTDTSNTDTVDTDTSDEDLLPAERIRRERLALKSQSWEEDFFDDGWFDWQTSQAVFEDDDA